MAKKIAHYESNEGHLVLVFEGRGEARLIGKSGMALAPSYISADPEILKTVQAVFDDHASALAILNGGTRLTWKAA